MMMMMIWKGFLSGLWPSAMGIINKCHTSIDGAHSIVPSREPRSENCDSQGVPTTKLKELSAHQKQTAY